MYREKCKNCTDGWWYIDEEGREHSFPSGVARYPCPICKGRGFIEIEEDKRC